MKAKPFKFKLSQHVFLLGHCGRCVITGRGMCEFVSGGKMPMYQISGGHNAWVQESSLVNREDAEAGGAT